MKKNHQKASVLRRSVCVLLAVLFAASLAACGGGEKKADANAVYFTNNLDSEVHNFYISPTDLDTWGDPMTDGIIKKGRTVTIDFDKVVNGEGTYDIGAIDENYMNYDLYGVDIHLRDTIILEGTAEGATYTIEHEDGSSNTYDAEVYKEQNAGN